MAPTRSPTPSIAFGAPDDHELPLALLRQGVEAVLAHESVEDGEFSITFVGDDRIRAFNRSYLGHDRVTDVLAFALHEEGEPPLGDIYIGADQARRQARDHAVPLEEELVRLAVHGVLHVLGYDHPEEPGPARDGSAQIRLQERLTRRIMDGRDDRDGPRARDGVR